MKMKRQTIWVVSLLGLAFLSGGSVFAKGGGGGGGGKGIQDRVRDPSAVVQQDRLRTQDKDQLRTLDKDPLRTGDRLRTPDQDQLKLRDQDRDRLHVPQ
jgi:membrane protein involved in colicin uptake